MSISKNYLYFALTGLAYYLFIKLTDFSLPCPFHYLTGYKCPGCGITTMLLELSNGNWQAAREANVFLFYTLPLLALFTIITQASAEHRVQNGKLYNNLLVVYALALLSFGIYRNIATI